MGGKVGACSASNLDVHTLVAKRRSMEPGGKQGKHGVCVIVFPSIFSVVTFGCFFFAGG